MTPSDSPARPSTTGPKVLVAAGVLVLVLAGALAAVGVRAFVGALPTGVVGPDGLPGADVVAEVPAGSTTTAYLTAGPYLVWLAAPTVDGAADGEVRLDGTPTVTGPDGDEVDVDRGWLTGSTSRGGVSAQVVAGFRAAEDGGPYRIDAPPVPGSDEAALLVVPDDGAVTFVGGILGVVGGLLGAGLLGAVAVGLLAGGGIWWYRRLNPPAVRTPRPGHR